jgi:hypothetical protein
MAITVNEDVLIIDDGDWFSESPSSDTNKLLYSNSNPIRLLSSKYAEGYELVITILKSNWKYRTHCHHSFLNEPLPALQIQFKKSFLRLTFVLKGENNNLDLVYEYNTKSCKFLLIIIYDNP